MSHAQESALNLRFEHISIDDGLSHSKVNVIFQDSRNFIWFGTNGGLNRFDGYEFKIYQNELNQSNSLSHNLIRDIFEDADGNLWIATDAGGLNLLDRDKDHFICYKHDPDDTTSLSNNSLNKIVGHSDSRMWIATRNGLNLFDPKTRQATHYFHYPANENSLSANRIQPLLLDSKNQLWIGYSDPGLDRLDPETGHVTHFNRKAAPQLPGEPASPFFENVLSLFEDRQGNIWIGTNQNGLFVYAPSENDFQGINGPDDETIMTIRAIYQDKNDNIWIASRLGLYIYSKKTGQMHMHDKSTDGVYGLIHQSVQTIFEDNKGDIWLGTRGGVEHFIQNQAAIRAYTAVANNNRYLNSEVIYSVVEDDNKNLWIGTEIGGINFYNRKTGRFTYYMHDSERDGSLSANNIKTIVQDKNNDLWIGTFDGGLNFFNTGQGLFSHFKHDPNDPMSISDDDVYSIIIDDKDHLWLATHTGVNVLKRPQMRFIRYMHDPDDPYSLSHNNCIVVYRDKSNVKWVATFNGLNRYNESTDNFTRYLHNPNDTLSLSNNYVQCMYEDSKGRFWVGTLGGGLNCMDRKTGEFYAYTKADGLSDNSIYGILEDNAGNLWLSTNDGLSKFNPESETFRNYDVDDGLLSNQFNYNAYHKGDDGTLYFGSMAGLVAFDPEQVRDNSYVPSIVFTEFQLFNRVVTIDTENSPLSKPIYETKEIVLSHKQTVMGFKFAALNYASSSDNKYAYRLEGFDKEWRHIGTNRSVTFTNLDPGTYTLHVKGSNNHGKWNDSGASIKLRITPPFWETTLFKSAVVLLLVVAVFGLVKLRTYSITRRNIQLQLMNDQLQTQIVERQRAEQQVQEQVTKLQSAQAKIHKLNEELELKVEQRTAELVAVNKELESFSYSVSHDLRAPLRSINGFSSALVEDYQDDLDDEARNYLVRIKSASERMGQLIDDLLELSRVSRKELTYQDVKISEIAQSIARDLKERDPGRKVRFEIEPDIHLFGDTRLLKIAMENLLSNAWKFTSNRESAFISVKKQCQNGHTHVAVCDNGAGFDMAYVNKLFQPFQRLHGPREFEGTGIGLATVQRIINRHGGNIWAEGEVGKGAKFYFIV